MRFAIGVLTLLSAISAEGQSPDAVLRSMREAAQRLIVVVTPDWDSAQGTLTRYEHQNGNWQRVGDEIPIVVGRYGLAWDPLIARGTPAAYPPPIKREGDGRSPAGVFQLENTFGFEPSLPGSNKYLPLTATTECVDDPASRNYAQIVDRQKVDLVDWKSSEKMREVPGYRWGVVVGYNMEHTIKDNGSCIFLHQWSGPAAGTAGCTAMAADHIEALVQWLADGKPAALVQLPKMEYQRLQRRWQLPTLDSKRYHE